MYICQQCAFLVFENKIIFFLLEIAFVASFSPRTTMVHNIESKELSWKDIPVYIMQVKVAQAFDGR